MVHLVDGADDVPVVAVVGQTGVEETGGRAASLSVNRSNNNRLNVIRDMNVTHCPSTRAQIVKITRLGMAPLCCYSVIMAGTGCILLFKFVEMVVEGGKNSYKLSRYGPTLASFQFIFLFLPKWNRTRIVPTRVGRSIH